MQARFRVRLGEKAKGRNTVRIDVSVNNSLMYLVPLPSAHPFVYSDGEVQLHQLTYVEDPRTGIKIRVINEVQKRWQEVGSLLEL